MKADAGKILIVDDDAEVLLAAELVLKRQFSVVTACTPASIEMLLSQHSFDVILLDMNFTAGATSGEEGIHWLRVARRLSPQAKVVLMTAYGGVDEAVNAMRAGAADFVVKPWDNAKLVATVSAVAQLSRADREVQEQRGRRQALSDVRARDSERIIGETGGMRQVVADIEKVAHTDANVLITGENGTGKELVARAIHNRSPRAGLPFVSVDLGAITETLFESELFGHRKGAFTDAREDRAGRFEAAMGGTLFLDEIGNLSLAMQAKLLGALESMTVTRVGADKPVRIDARVLCATNLAHRAAARSGAVPAGSALPHQHHRDPHSAAARAAGDIPLLVAHYAQYYARKYGRPELRIAERRHGTPAAVSLAGQCARAQARGRARRDHERQRQFSAGWHHAAAGGGSSPPGTARSTSTSWRNRPSSAPWCSYQGNLTRAAQALGLGRTTLYRKMARHGLQ